jgi:hypothetical protein
MVGAWPDMVLANRYMWYTFSDESEYKTNALAVTSLLYIWTLFPLLWTIPFLFQMVTQQFGMLWLMQPPSWVSNTMAGMI